MPTFPLQGLQFQNYPEISRQIVFLTLNVPRYYLRELANIWSFIGTFYL